MLEYLPLPYDDELKETVTEMDSQELMDLVNNSEYFNTHWWNHN